MTNKITKIEPTGKQKRAFKEIVDNGRNKGEAMKIAGYSENTAKAPTKMTESKGWQELMDKYLPDNDLAIRHKELLNATRLEHMVFPKSVKDKEIKSLLESVNCNVRKIQHGDQANHVWFWAKDNIALKSALDLAYKLKGKYSAEKIKIIDDNDEKTDEELNREEERINERIAAIRKKAKHSKE